MPRVVVVGGGISGLAAACELADAAEVTVVERLPAVGGTRHFDHPDVERLMESCRRRGVRFELGATGLRWESGRLLVASPGSVRWLPADHLLFAGGCRPATAGEARILGGRLAGVVTAPVAVHLMEAGVKLGTEPVIVGVSSWADKVASHLQAAKTPICSVSATDVPRPVWAAEYWPAWRAESVLGAGRVRELRIVRTGDSQRILCDAVVLADGVRPVRNVDGAVYGGEHVTYAQLPETHVTAEAVEHARDAARSVISSLGRQGS
jgi:D-hydroxyproline dehydrogenase subunit alpha